VLGSYTFETIPEWPFSHGHYCSVFQGLDGKAVECDFRRNHTADDTLFLLPQNLTTNDDSSEEESDEQQSSASEENTEHETDTEETEEEEHDWQRLSWELTVTAK